MTAVLGFASWGIAAFVPGLAFESLIFGREARSLSQRVLAAFVCSMASHCVLVGLATTMGLGGIRGLVISYFLIGIVASMIFLRREKDSARAPKGHGRIGRDGLLLIALRLLGIWILAGGAFYFYRNFGRVFDSVDSIMSWNKWATHWYLGQFAFGTWNYPQLVPMVWSLMYHWIGTSEIELFVRPWMAIFFFMALLTFLAWGKREFPYQRLVSLIVLSLLYRKVITSHEISSGYVDVAISFFYLQSFFWLYRWLSEVSTKKKKSYAIMLGMSIFCACHTKQSGLLLLLMIPSLVWRDLTEKGQKLIWPVPRIRGLVIFYLLACLSWYLFSQYRIQVQGASSEVSYLLYTIHGSRTLWQRGAHALGVLSERTGMHSGLVFLFLLIPLLRLRHFVDRYLILICYLPYTLIWAMVYSYDPRNLSPVFGLYALLIGNIVGPIIERLDVKKIKLELNLKEFKWGMPMVFAGLVTGLLIAGYSFPRSRIEAMNREAKLSVIYPVESRLIFDQIRKNPKFRFLSSQPYYSQLSIFKEHHLFFPYRFKDMLIKKLDENKGSLDWIMLSSQEIDIAFSEDPRLVGRLKPVYESYFNTILVDQK